MPGLVDRDEEQADAVVLRRVGSVRAPTQYHSAKCAEVVHIFWPLSRQPVRRPARRVGLEPHRRGVASRPGARCSRPRTRPRCAGSSAGTSPSACRCRGAMSVLPMMPTPFPICGPPRPREAPRSGGTRRRLLPPSRRTPSARSSRASPASRISVMNARRFGVSTICAMFSRVRSKTSGSSCSSRNTSTCSANACCSGEKSKSMKPYPCWSSPRSDGSSDSERMIRGSGPRRESAASGAGAAHTRGHATVR